MKAVIFPTIALVLLSAAGCSSSSHNSHGELLQIGLAYVGFYDRNHRPAENVEELQKDFDSAKGEPFLADPEAAWSHLKDGSYVLLWGKWSKTGLSDTVVGYEKGAADGGGNVLFLDGSVRRMTASEFQAAKKASD